MEIKTGLKALPLALFTLLSFSRGAVFAQAIRVNEATFESELGNVTNLETLLIFITNLMKYIGWAGVIIGIVIVLALLIYKLIGTDDESTMKTVQGGITKAIIIVVIGLLILSAAFLIEFVAELLGFTNFTVNATQ